MNLDLHMKAHAPAVAFHHTDSTRGDADYSLRRRECWTTKRYYFREATKADGLTCAECGNPLVGTYWIAAHNWGSLDPAQDGRLEVSRTHPQSDRFRCIPVT